METQGSRGQEGGGEKLPPKRFCLPWATGSRSLPAAGEGCVPDLCEEGCGGKDFGVTLGMASGLMGSVGNLGSGSPLPSAIEGS